MPTQWSDNFPIPSLKKKSLWSVQIKGNFEYMLENNKPT